MKIEYLSRAEVIAKLEQARGGDTQTDFAARIGIKLSTYNDTLKGRRPPGEKILAFLSTAKDELVEEVVYRFKRRA